MQKTVAKKEELWYNSNNYSVRRIPNEADDRFLVGSDNAFGRSWLQSGEIPQQPDPIHHTADKADRKLSTNNDSPAHNAADYDTYAANHTAYFPGNGANSAGDSAHTADHSSHGTNDSAYATDHRSDRTDYGSH